MDMETVAKVRAAHPGTIVFFLWTGGDSFRTFGEDAHACWATTDAATAADVFSVARHDAEALMANLVAAGHRVAVAERTR